MHTKDFTVLLDSEFMVYMRMNKFICMMVCRIGMHSVPCMHILYVPVEKYDIQY